MSPHSLWSHTASRVEFPNLDRDESADVVVIGAGIAGVTTAYRLAQEGLSVEVLERADVSSGETEHTTAHLASAMDDRFVQLERLHGVTGARLAAESHAAAIDEIERITGAENIDCGFERVDGYLFSVSRNTADILEEELAAARRAGLTGTELVPRAPLSAFNTGPALRFPNQA